MKNNYQSHTYIVAAIVIGLFLLFSIKPVTATPLSYSYFQEVEISGTITDKDGLSVPGATVSIKDSNNGTLTNMEGNYTLTAPAGATLIISYLGFKSREVAVDGREEINIQLEEDVEALGAVEINAGYYNTTERERTGNISRVSGKEIELQPVVSPLQALQGRMAGVEIVQETGIPGAAPTIRIRGQNSLRTGLGNNGNLPLYIIDGVPINSAPVTSINRFSNTIGTDPLNGIDLANIKSIEVLKDADATAIYGSRGANGVILITTKKGSTGNNRQQIDAQVYGGISRISNFLNLLNTPQYLSLRRQAFENDGIEPTTSNAEDLILWDRDRQTNWQKELFGKSAPTLNASVNYSGGGKLTRFNLGASYLKQENVFPGNHAFEKKTVNLTINHQSPNEKFHLNLSANYGITENDIFSSDNFVETALNLAPNAPALYNDDGSLNWENSSWDNPLAALESKGQTVSNNLVANLGLEYKFNQDLFLKANLGYTTLESRDNILMPIQLYDPAIWDRTISRSQHSQIQRRSWIAEPQLSYSKSINNHQVDAIIGTTFQRNLDNRLSLNGTGYSNDHFIGNLNAADAVSVSADQQFIYNYQAVFARIGYNWDHSYFLNLTGRRDGSSRFGPENRFSNFGAVGAAWIFSNTKFINENLRLLSFGKLRASYGITGNDQIGDYQYMDTYEPTPGPGGLYPTQLTNPVFSWESTHKLEVALELGFVDNRFNLNLSWYQNRSSNQLVGYTLPAITGFNSVEANLPATVQNSGLEIEFSGELLQTRNFLWSGSLNLSIPRNKLLEFEGLKESSYATAYEINKPLSIIKQYQFDGVNPETGLYQVIDIDGNGTLNYEDRVIINNLGRRFYGGIGSRASYKDFSLNFLMEFVNQKGLSYNSGVPGFKTNILDDGRYTVDGHPQSENFQKPTQAISGFLAYRDYLGSSARITDASFLRMKSINLNYKIPLHEENLAVSNLRLFIQGQNLFTITDYKGLDPQNPGSTNLPALQSITAGIQVNF